MAKKDTVSPASSNDAERIQRWRWMLEQNVPIIGGWMHRRITSALTESALAGSWLAAQSLAVVFVFHNEAEVRKQAGQTLRRVNYATGIDAVWGVWVETRHPGLEQIASGYNRIASQPASVRLLSALCMDSLSSITHGSDDLVPPLIQACTDQDPIIAGRAKEAIAHLHNQSSIDRLCQAWQATRSPFLSDVMQRAGYVAQKTAETRVLSALNGNHLKVVMDASPEMVPALVKAAVDEDAQIALRAKACLLQLQKPNAVDEFCRMWADTRSPLLEETLMQAGYQAHNPERVRLLVALKTGRQTAAEKASPQGLSVLLSALSDPDETIRGNARLALNHLQDDETRDALCVLAINKPEDPLAREVALQNGYAPRSVDLRALFFFLTEQWQAYDELDFDQRILRAIYEASQSEMRQRIASCVQAAGRTDYLTILAGVDYRSRAEEVNPGEASLMIRILNDNKEYARLWALAPELALPFSLQIIRLLDDAGWRPENEADRPVFDDLVRISRQPVMLEPQDLARALPLAISRATLKVKGRINEVAFSPAEPVLAIGTSQRKVVLWNFQTASVERVLDGFRHSVGKVSYTPRGVLMVAERTSTQASCTVTLYQGDEKSSLCAHEGTVTVLEPVGENLVLTAGRDNKAVLYDVDTNKQVAGKEYPFWARSAAISPDLQYAALLHDRLSLVRIPELTIVPGYAYLPPRDAGFKSGVAQKAAFSPDGKYLLTGQHNGQVGLYFHTSLTQRPRKVLVTQHMQPVRGIHFLPGHPLVITAGAEGQVRFLRWPEMTSQGMVFAPEGQLTSLRISSQGAFMATGTSDASLVLWDLRVLDIPNLFTQPLATATHEQITNVMALSEYHTLPDAIRNGLKFLRLLLQYRFRYDIQIEEAPIIQYGDFDIILDEK